MSGAVEGNKWVLLLVVRTYLFILKKATIAFSLVLANTLLKLKCVELRTWEIQSYAGTAVKQVALLLYVKLYLSD